MRESIYVIDDIIVGGDFQDGSRCNDHNCLLEVDYKNNSQYFITNEGRKMEMKYTDLLKWGTIVVPEETAYISNEKQKEFEEIGFDRLPLDDNHIAGYKKSETVSTVKNKKNLSI